MKERYDSCCNTAILNFQLQQTKEKKHPLRHRERGALESAGPVRLGGGAELRPDLESITQHLVMYSLWVIALLTISCTSIQFGVFTLVGEWLFNATLTAEVISWRGRPDNVVEVGLDHKNSSSAGGALNHCATRAPRSFYKTVINRKSIPAFVYLY